MFKQLLVVHRGHLRDFQGRPEILHVQNPYTRGSIVTVSLFHQLESSSSCVARLEIKLNARSLLNHYELSERPARYKILHTTEHE
jgi:hypothetical protein